MKNVIITTLVAVTMATTSFVFGEQQLPGRELFETVQKEFYSHKLDTFLAELHTNFENGQINPTDTIDNLDEPMSLRQNRVGPSIKKKHQDLIRKRNKKLLKAAEADMSSVTSREAVNLASYFLTPDEEKALDSFRRLELQNAEHIEAPSKKAVATVLREYKIKKQWLDEQLQKETSESLYKQKIALELAKLDAVEKTLHDFPVSSLKRKFSQYQSAALKNIVYEIDFSKLKELTKTEVKNLEPLEKNVVRIICDYLNETKKANQKLLEKIHYETSTP